MSSDPPILTYRVQNRKAYITLSPTGVSERLQRAATR